MAPCLVCKEEIRSYRIEVPVMMLGMQVGGHSFIACGRPGCGAVRLSFMGLRPLCEVCGEIEDDDDHKEKKCSAD